MTPIEQMVAVADRLRKLPCGFAFLGGAVLGVLVTDRAAKPRSRRSAGWPAYASGGVTVIPLAENTSRHTPMALMPAGNPANTVAT